MITENAHIFVMVVCLLVVIVLMIGLGGFAFGGDFNKKYANKLMRLRILLQAIAILLIIFCRFLISSCIEFIGNESCKMALI